MSNSPIVSIVMTVFKRTEYLEEAIQSVLNQNFSNFELIITDDADTEAARNICNCFKSDARVRYRSNSEIRGAPRNIAAAMKEAKGEFITIINDDDIMEKDMLEELVAPLEMQTQCAISFADHWLMDSEGKILRELTDTNTKISGRGGIAPGPIADPWQVALEGGIPLVMGTMFRKSSFREDWLVPDVEGAYDYWLSLNLARAGQGHYSSKRLMRWRVHMNSESARLSPDKAKCAVYIFQQLAKLDLAPGQHNYIVGKLSHHLFVLGRDQLYFNSRKEAFSSFMMSFRQFPNFKSAIGLALTFLPKSLYTGLCRTRYKVKIRL